MAANASPKTSRERQSKRLAQLNKIARRSGFGSWSKYETAVINQMVSIPEIAVQLSEGKERPSNDRNKN